MPAIINNFYGTYVERIDHYVQNQYNQPAEVEEVTEEPKRAVSSLLFTKKAKQEGREAEIKEALQGALCGRRDKARALVEEVREWQKDGYLDANYNARVMYDALNEMLVLPFEYDGFRKYYNE